MAEIIFSIGMVFTALFIMFKVLGVLGRICGLSDLRNTIGHTYTVGSGTFNSED